METSVQEVYYIASPDSPVDRYLYRSRLDGRGKTERITPADAPAGHHGYMISPDAKYAMHTFSNSETPTAYEIVTLPGHKTIRTLEDNHELADRFAAVNPGPKEFFKVDIGDVVLDGWMIKPADFVTPLPHIRSSSTYTASPGSLQSRTHGAEATCGAASWLRKDTSS